MFVDPKMMNRVSTMTQHMVSQLSPKQQEAFWMQFGNQSIDPGGLTLLALLGGWHFIKLDKIGILIPYLLTGGGCGIWWLVEIITAGKRGISHNDELASRLIMQVKSTIQ
jgi:hypothetical protein